MDNLENRQRKVTIFFTPEIFEQLEKYRVETGSNSSSFSAYVLVKLGLKSLGSQWVNCDDRLPEPYKLVLGYSSVCNDYFFVRWSDELGKFLFEGNSYAKIALWCELPNLPSVQGGDSNG